MVLGKRKKSVESCILRELPSDKKGREGKCVAICSGQPRGRERSSKRATHGLFCVCRIWPLSFVNSVFGKVVSHVDLTMVSIFFINEHFTLIMILMFFLPK